MGTPLSVKELHLLLQKCIAARDLRAGRDVQRLIARHGFQSNPFLGSHLIRMFALCGNLHEANEVFNMLNPRTVFAWSAIILAHVDLGDCHRAIDLFYLMQHSGHSPNSYIFVAVLKACASLLCLHLGMLIHTQAILEDCELDVFVVNALIDMYAKCGNLEDALTVFNSSRKQSIATWTVMIAAYSAHEHSDESLQLFHQMNLEGMPPNDITFLCVLKACGSPPFLTEGKMIHENIRRSCFSSDEMVGNALICMYAKCGSLYYARKVFDELPKQNVVTWNAMVSGYGQQGCGGKALQLFKLMPEQGVNPNKVTFASILKASASVPALEEGRKIHNKITMFGTECDAFMDSTMIDMYSQCGSLKDAFGVFNNLPKRELFTWSAMISGLVHHLHCIEAFVLFDEMLQEGVEPNSIVFVSILKACSSLGLLDLGKYIHMFATLIGCSSNDILLNVLIDMYAKTGSIEDARVVFDNSPNKDVIGWNAMIFGCAEHGLDEEALYLFQQMQSECNQSTVVTFVSALRACADITTLEWGRIINCYINQAGCESDVVVGNSLIDMYARCESLDDALRVFTNLPHRNNFTWSAIIVGCAQCCNLDLALKYFAIMQQEGFNFNEVLLVSLLIACSHVGMVNEAFYYFNLMEHKYGIVPSFDHYCCVIDLLGRMGCINEADDLLHTIPCEIECTGWSSLLSHCRTYGSVEVGNMCFDNFVLLDHRHASSYVLMCKVLKDANMWIDAERVQDLKANALAWKKPGKALIKIRSQVFEFCVSDKNDTLSEDLHFMHRRLCVRLKDNAYMPQLDSTMRPFSFVEEDLACIETAGHS